MWKWFSYVFRVFLYWKSYYLKKLNKYGCWHEHMDWGYNFAPLEIQGNVYGPICSNIFFRIFSLEDFEIIIVLIPF